MYESYLEYRQEKYEIDLRAVKWYAQELIDASYNGPLKRYLFDMESNYRASLQLIIGYFDHKGRYVDGYLDAPFWDSVEEGLCRCIEQYKRASIRHPNNRLYPAVVVSAKELLDYIMAGE